MNTGIARDLELARDKAQYDENAKRLLGNVWILAWILKCSIQEFRNITLGKIVRECICGEILISKVRMEPGTTNYIPERILGDNTEDRVPGEGGIHYDIRFTAYVPGSDTSVKLLLNVEAQRTFNVGYPLITRGIFYGARMISAQLDTEFTVDDYSGLKKVYSIWICMNAPEYIGNAISTYDIKKTDYIVGIPNVVKDYDKLSVVMVCINRTAHDGDEQGLIRLLNTLFSENMPIEEKKKILSEDYGIAMEYEQEEGMKNMCNLSEGIYERGIECGIERGKLLNCISIIRSKIAKGKDVITIAEFMEESVEFVQKIACLLTEKPTLTDMDIVDSLSMN